MNRSTSASAISVVRDHASADTNAKRIGGWFAAKSDGCEAIARARQEATSLSEYPPNRSAGRPSAFARRSLTISSSSVSSPSRPGSDFNSSRNPSSPVASSHSDRAESADRPCSG
jgi:hypothetical protein